MKLYLPLSHRDPLKTLKDFHKEPEEGRIKKGERRVLKLFHEMARRVPAYKKFLKKKKFNPNQVKTIKDFRLIPLISKDKYLKKYKREDLCWDGKFKDKQWEIAATSGSSGEPFYF